MWRDAYQRRGCSLTFDEYVWHERRKPNKFAFDGDQGRHQLCGGRALRRRGSRGGTRQTGVLRQRVTDDFHAFDYPAARFEVAEAEIPEVLSYNPTFTGQARKGETVEAAGWVEQLDNGRLAVSIARLDAARGTRRVASKRSRE